ncbi:MAG: DUF58 domain-containing protein [Bacteroidales bacterium]|jgi:uncharacterized protein (DUF58 family)|nr:DUF58 domain-containing protein [Bacteroidales bacterium]
MFDYSSIEFIANKVVEGFITGLHKSPFHGFSVEFAEHRLYNQGESTRHIDWKLYGRTDKLFVKKYEEETNLRCQLVIDCSSSMFFPFHSQPSLDKPNKITFAIYAAGVLISLLYKQRDAFGLNFVSDTIEMSTDTKSGFAHRQYLFQLLEQTLRKQPPQHKQTKIDDILHLLAEKIHRRSLVVVFTDLFSSLQSDEALIDSLRHLRHSKHEVILFHIFDQKQEVNFDYPERPFKFIDLETNEQIKLRPSEVKESYAQATKARLNAIRQACEKSEIDFVTASISNIAAESSSNKLSSNFDQILIPYILKREKMSR